MRYTAWNRQSRALRLPSWQIALLLVLAVSLGIAIAVVATGVFLIALPIVAIAVLGYRLFGGARRRPRPSTHVIEGEYEIIKGAQPRRGREPGQR
jgi:hypothetical protein